MIAGIDRRSWSALALIVTVGLSLRVLGAQGPLWLDEAWSAQLAHDAGTPIGVFLNINHDNNHHLNSLWLQFVGFDASPMLARALSIVTGTLAIVAAAFVAAPRGKVAMLVTAWLFAVSAILVTLGSEARGYAPMSLALLTSIAIVDRQLAGSSYSPQRALALCFLLGALSQLTIVFGVCAIIGWYALAMWSRTGFTQAAIATVRLFAIPVIALAAALALVFVPALLSPTGFQFGRYDPFDLLQYLHGVTEMIGYAVTYPIESGWQIAGMLVLVVIARPARVSRVPFFWLAVAAFPLTLAVLKSGNVAHPRYYLIAGIALLLLLGELIAIGWTARGWRRVVAAAGLLAFTGSALALDGDLIRHGRGTLGTTVAMMRARAPAGATVIVERDSSNAMIAQAAAHLHYPVRIQEAPCPRQDFLVLDRSYGEHFPSDIRLCGVRYRPTAAYRWRSLSGMPWTLYEPRP